MVKMGIQTLQAPRIVSDLTLVDGELKLQNLKIGEESSTQLYIRDITTENLGNLVAYSLDFYSLDCEAAAGILKTYPDAAKYVTLQSHDGSAQKNVLKLIAGGMKLRNWASGVTLTFDTFDTDPTTPANITDGDWSTVSGWGSKTTSGAATIGNMKYDLGSGAVGIPMLHVLKYGGKASASYYQLFPKHSDDDSTYHTTMREALDRISTTGEEIHLVVWFSIDRYNLINIWGSGAHTAQIRLYELQCFQLMGI